MARLAAPRFSEKDLGDDCPPYKHSASTENFISLSLFPKTPERASYNGPKTPTITVREIRSNDVQLSQRPIEWGVKWGQQPAFMILCALLGFLLAMGHHALYLKLDHTFAGSEGRQQWAHGFGNILAILVATSFAFASRAAYKQYFWTVVRRKSFTIKALDSLYSLSSDPLGFFNIEVWQQATLAAFLALACWTLSLTPFLPPGSLTVAPGLTAETVDMAMPQLNWNSDLWTSTVIPGHPPSAAVSDLVTQSAEQMKVLDFQAPAPNSSYSIDVRGPFLQCEAPNSTQIPTFRYYQRSLYLNPGSVIAMVTKKTLPLAVELFNTTSYLHQTDAVDPQGVRGLPDLHGVVMTAFDPLVGEGLADLRPVSGDLIEPLNTWQVDLPSNFGRSMGYTPSICQPVAGNATEPGDTPQCQMFPFQLWVVTSDDSFICTLGNGTRTANFNFVDGDQTISYGELRDFDPVFAPRQIFLTIPDGNGTQQIDVDYQVHSYMSVYLSLQNMLSGNLTMWIPWTSSTPPFLTDQNFVLRTGLDACDSIKNNTWSQNYTNDLFEKPDYMCRNRSLARAIEDLATNVTISMMTSSDLTSPNATMTQVTLNSTRNIYIYRPFLLVLSYGIALILTIPSVGLGIYAFHSNGVAHSNAFSAIIATTRNPGLDVLSDENSFGAFPLDKEASKVRLRYGGVDSGKQWKRAAFGMADEVTDLKKGNFYI